MGENMINESQKFLNFLKKKRKAVSFLFAVTLLLYLPMLTNFSYSIDSEAVVDNSKDLLFSWLTIDRFGLVALKKFFLFGLDLNPYFINTLTYLLMAFSAVILLYIIDQLIQTTPWIPLLAVTLYLVSPIHFEQNSFVLQSVEVMIGFNLMFVGMIALGMPGNKVSPKRLIFGMLFLTASFSIYPSIVIGASTLAIIILHLHELNKPFATFSVYFRHLVRYIALILSSLLTYVALDQIIKYFAHAPKNSYIQTAWGHMDNSLLMQIALAKFKQFFIFPNQPFELSVVTYLAVVTFALVLIMGLIRKQIRWTILLDIIAEYILVLSLLILLGNMIGPIRSLTPTVPLVMIVYSLTVMTMMPNKRLLLVVGMSFSIFALMLSKTTSDLEQSFIISYENEVKFSDKIVTSVQELGINNFDQYRLVIVGEKRFNSPLTEMGEMIGNTHYNWDLDSPTGSNRRVTNFLSSQGYKFATVSPIDYRKAQRISLKMKTFPAKGGIKVLGKMIVVNLKNTNIVN